MAVGSEALILVYSLERLVSLLRLLSEESAFADLLPTLRVEEVQNSLGARGYLLRFSCGDSRTLDRCAGAAAFCLGTLCIGAERHFVAYRDRKAPLGYDVAELVRDNAEYVLYTATSTQTYARVTEVPLLRILLRLQLVPRPGGLEASAAGRALASGLEELWLLIPCGLLARALRFLWERGVEAAVALPELLPPAGEPQTALPSLVSQPALVRLLAAGQGEPLGSAPLKLILELPGARALQRLSEHIAVEVGHVHPLRLLAFERLFDKARRHLFLTDAKNRTTATLTLPATPFVPAERLIELRYAPDGTAGTASQLLPTPQQLAFSDGVLPQRRLLRLHGEHTLDEAPAATLVPWTQARTLGRLLCLLPASLLSALRAVCIEPGILLIGGSAALVSLPIGQPFYEAAPAVLVPLGMRLVPRLRGDLLRSKLGGDGVGCVVFLPAGAPIAIAHESFAPAGAALVARLLPSEKTAHQEVPPSPPPTVVNDSLGLLWPLWSKPPKSEGQG